MSGLGFGPLLLTFLFRFRYREVFPILWRRHRAGLVTNRRGRERDNELDKFVLLVCVQSVKTGHNVEEG